MAVKSKRLPDTTPEYPRLMIGRESGTVVLFTDYQVGVVVHEGEAGVDPVGYSCASWAMSSFAQFDGTITLRND